MSPTEKKRPIHPSLVKAKLTKMKFTGFNDPSKEEKEQEEEEVKEEYLECHMLYSSENSCFGTIKNDIKKICRVAQKVNHSQRTRLLDN